MLDLGDVSFSPSLVRYYKSNATYNDFDLYSQHGFYQIISVETKANRPPGITGHGFIMNFGWENSRTIQYYYGGSGSVGIWMRVCVNNNWDSWKTIWTAT